MVWPIIDLVDRADVGVVELRCRFRFAVKPFQALFVAQQVRRQKLQGYRAAELGVLGLVDNTHAALAEFFGDEVVRDGLADHSSSIVPRRLAWRAQKQKDRIGQEAHERPEDDGPQWSSLTPRERQIASLVAQGHRYKEIAKRLGISAQTVRNHLRNIFDKLRINDRVQLAIFVLQRHN